MNGAWWKSAWAAWVGVLAVIATLWGGLLAIDGRYARAEDVKAEMRTLQQSVLEGQRGTLEREEFELLREKQRRRLTSLEETRLRMVQKQLDKLDKRIKGLGGKP